MDNIVYSLAVLKDGPTGNLYLAGLASGLMVSPDSGNTWQPAYESLGLNTDLPTMALAVAKPGEAGEGDSQIVFAGVVGGVLSSRDGGKTWSIAQFPDPPPAVSCLVISTDFAHDGVLLAGTMEDGVFRSADGGRTWNRWNFGLLDMNVLALESSQRFKEDETLYAGTETGIFRSTNGGRAWREMDFPMDFAPVLCLALSPHYAEDGILLAGTESNGLFLSRDRGKTWQNSGSFGDESINAIAADEGQDGELRLLALVGGSLFTSDNTGHIWDEWNLDAPVAEGISCMLAAEGLRSGSPVLVGTVDGRVLTLRKNAIR